MRCLDLAHGLYEIFEGGAGVDYTDHQRSIAINRLCCRFRDWTSDMRESGTMVGDGWHFLVPSR